MPLIETRGIYQSREGNDILRDINLTVERGEVFALIGPTGAGKTTLLRLLDLLDFPTSGQVYFDGVDITGSNKQRLEIRRQMAFVLQKPVVFNASVYDNIACGLKWRGTVKDDIRSRVNATLDMIGLADYSSRKARTLSGGETQRVAIARALVTEPDILLLDEPTANLDPGSTSRVEELIAGIIDRYHTTIILTTHDMSQGQRLADRAGMLINGELLQTGAWREVFDSPRNRDIASFVGIENILDGVVAASEDRVVTIKTAGRDIQALSDQPAGSEVSACIRSEDVTLALAPLSSSARNSFDGIVSRVAVTGPVARIDIDCGFPLAALVTKRSAEEMGLEKGKQIYATFKATAVHVIGRR